MFLELMYNRNDTEFNYTRNGIKLTTVGLATEYYQIGGLQQVGLNEIVKAFAAVTVGATRFHPKESYDWEGNGSPTYLSDAWAFSTTLGAGLKLMFTERIGIRLQGRLLLPMRFEGLFVGIGTGGTSGGASFSVPLVSGDFTAGLVISIGK